MRVRAISEDRPYLRQHFYPNQSVTSTFSLAAVLLMDDVVQATRPLYQIQKRYLNPYPTNVENRVR